MHCYPEISRVASAVLQLHGFLCTTSEGIRGQAIHRWKDTDVSFPTDFTEVDLHSSRRSYHGLNEPSAERQILTNSVYLFSSPTCEAQSINLNTSRARSIT